MVFKKEATVPFGKHFIDNSAYACEGYSIQVLDHQVYSNEEFFEKYNVEAIKGRKNDFYFTVKIKLYNENKESDEMHGISLWNIDLKSINDFIIPEMEMTVEINSLCTQDC